MITSTLAQLHWYKTISPNFEKAISYALSTDFRSLETGRYSVEGENVMAIVNEYTTKPLSECDPESHRDYADIQIVISGADSDNAAEQAVKDASILYRLRDTAPADGEESIQRAVSDFGSEPSSDDMAILVLRIEDGNAAR